MGDDFFEARFYRYDHDDGYMATIKQFARPINATTLSYQVPSREAHQEAREKAWTYTKKKLDKFIKVAEKWGYRVNVIEGSPPRPRPGTNTWNAGMQYPLPDFVKDDKEPNYFR